MNKDEAREVVTRYGAKLAQIDLLRRRLKEIDATLARLVTEAKMMAGHAADAAAVLEEAK